MFGIGYKDYPAALCGPKSFFLVRYIGFWLSMASTAFSMAYQASLSLQLFYHHLVFALLPHAYPFCHPSRFHLLSWSTASVFLTRAYTFRFQGHSPLIVSVLAYSVCPLLQFYSIVATYHSSGLSRYSSYQLIQIFSPGAGSYSVYTIHSYLTSYSHSSLCYPALPLVQLPRSVLLLPGTSIYRSIVRSPFTFCVQLRSVSGCYSTFTVYSLGWY